MNQDFVPSRDHNVNVCLGLSVDILYVQGMQGIHSIHAHIC